ncbi:MAG: hypothetical protein EA350_08920 [Gemmatimonadales bacterium]|nr:MAG: hypothetical protein EA350_08920 [Gemmatimonadales bacterium]
MTSPGTPRFRFRAPDGSEVSVGSVEDLSSRLEAGELRPDTPLFDAGTGAWARAGDVPVFQFVLEELRAEGRLPPEEEVLLLPDPPPSEPIDAGAAFEPIRHDADAPRPRASPTTDPFELHLPLSNPLDPLEGAGAGRREEAGGRDGPAGDAEAGAAADPGLGADPDASPRREKGAAPSGDGEDAAEPWFEDRPFTEAEVEPAGKAGQGTGQGKDEPRTPSSRPPREGERGGSPRDPDIDPSPLHAWLTHGPPAPAVPPAQASATREAPDDVPGRRPSTGPGSTPEEAADRSSVPLDADADAPRGSPAPTAPPLRIRTAWEDDAEVEDPRAVRLQARRRRRNARTLAGLVAVAILVIGGAAIFATTRSTGVATAPDTPPGSLPGDVAPDPAVALNGVAPPPGLEAEANLLWRDLPGQVSGVVDSLRVEAGLSDAPPREWLGGYYLANAREFPEVVAFWESYGAFVERLSGQDAELAQTAARRAMGQGAASELEALEAPDRERLLAFVAERHDRMRPARIDRFLHLQRTAEAALGLHEFLVQNGASITHSPALGRGLSADPVLEAVTETPAVRREMEGHLDRIFEALDRTRGGGQPSLAGLRSELFGSLGRPL